MKFIKIEQSRNKDLVATEDTILENLKNSNDAKKIDIECADFNWSDFINANGIAKTQEVVDEYSRKFKNPEKAIYICQHISVGKINWRSRNVFTPHATINKFKCIPHYAVNQGKNKKIHDRKYITSFIGSFETNICRSYMYHSFRNYLDSKETYFKDTGKWHFYHRDLSREEEYKKTLSDTIISLCPRGTGPSTIRLWESMATGCIPFIISDQYTMPLSDHVNWGELVISIPPWHALLSQRIIEKLKSNIDYSLLQEKSNKICDAYQKYFSNENLHMSVLENIKRDD